MPPTPQSLTEIGEALYGAFFRPQLAEVLGVTDRTLRRWLAGTSPIPARIWPELAGACVARAVRLHEVANLITRGGKS